MAFERTAREMGEDATLSIRQLSRWMDGKIDRPRPVSRRVAEKFWGHTFEALLGPSDHSATLSPLRVSSGIGERDLACSPTGTDRVAVTSGWFRPTQTYQPPRIAICGSRSAECDEGRVDTAVVALSRWLIHQQYEVAHGPRGVGIEVMTYIANHYRPPNLRAAVGIFGHPNVVRDADYVIVIGGGRGTLDETDLAISMGKKILPYGATCGCASAVLDRMRTVPRLREWIMPDLFERLDSCTLADEFIELVEEIIVANVRINTS